MLASIGATKPGKEVAIKGEDEVSQGLVARAEWDADRVSVSITLDRREHHLWFATSGEDPGSETDFLLPLALFPAMVSGSRLKLPGEVSPRLLSAVPKIQDVFRLWGEEHWGGKFQDLQRVSVDAEARSEPADLPSGIACLFSGGVDSFYTLLKNRDEVTHIIFVHGFDVGLEDRALRVQVSRMAREVAGELGKILIEVETNLRSFSDTSVGWGKYHGAALASIALLFQHRFRKVLIAAGLTYAELVPRGSHAMLDPLWSTELTEIEHDGCEVTRVDKLAYLSGHELPMHWLRVCFKNPDGAYNCGRCEKCLRTMISLRIVGALERCKTLPSGLDLQEVANMDIPDGTLTSQQNLKALERLGTEPELTRALAEALDKSSGTGEARAAHTERHHLHEQLLRARQELEQTRARLEASRRIAERSRARSKRFARRNHLLTARYSARRYRFADAFVGIVLRIPGIGKLVRRKNTAENR